MTTEAPPPTAYRLLHWHGEVDSPLIDRKTKRAAWRLISPAETLHRAGRLSNEQWAAYRTFERDMDRADRMRSVTAAYAERLGASLDDLANDLLCPVTRRMDAYRRVISKLEFIGYPRACYVLVESTRRECSLADLATEVLGMERNRGSGFAEALLQAATYRLAEYDGLITDGR